MTQDRQQHQDPNIVGPVIIIGIGILFLLQNQNYINSKFWGVLFRFWPVLIILLGIQLLIAYSRIGKVVMLLITLATFTLLVDYSLESTTNPSLDFLPTQQVVSVFQLPQQTTASKRHAIIIDNSDLDTANPESLELKINHGVGELIVSDQPSQHLFKLESFNSVDKPTLEIKSQDEAVSAQINTAASVPRFNPTFNQSHQLNLSTTLPTDISLKTGAGSSIVKLKNSNINRLQTQVGVGALTLHLSQTSLPKETLGLDVGVGSINLIVPAEIGYKVSYQIGLGSLIANGSRLGGSGTYRSQNYDTAEFQLDIQAKIGTGTIKIASQEPD